MRISQEAITPDIDIAFATRFVELEVEAAEEGGEDGVEFCVGESGRGGGGLVEVYRGEGGKVVWRDGKEEWEEWEENVVIESA